MTNNPVLKEDLNRYFSKKDKQMANRQKKDNISSHDINTNQNQNDILLHIQRDIYNQKDRQEQVLTGM